MAAGAAGLLILPLVETPSRAAAQSPEGVPADQFDAPRVDLQPGVIWFWNQSDMTPALVHDQLAEMRAHGFARIYLFPLASTPPWYTDEWLTLLGSVLSEAQANGQEIYLFNDNYDPSGRGAGIVVNGGTRGNKTFQPRPDLRPQSLSRTVVPATGGEPVGVATAWPGLGTPPPYLSIVDGALFAQSGDITVLNVGTDWTDYTLSFDVKPQPTGGAGSYAQAGWLVRASDPQNGYLYLLSTYPYQGEGSYLIRAAISEGTIVSFQPIQLSTPLDLSAFTQVSQALTGNHLVTKINGQVVDDATDTRFGSGTFGIRQNGLEYATFDNIAVTAPDGTQLFFDDFSSPTDLQPFAPRLSPDAVIAVAGVPVADDGGIEIAGTVDLTAKFGDQATWTPPPGHWQMQYFERTYLTSLGGDGGYFDLLNSEAVSRFIEVIYAEIYRRYPWAFGTVLKGFWDDEPTIPTAALGLVPWSESLPAALSDLRTQPALVLPALFADGGRAGRLGRGAFWRAVNDRWAQAWYRQQATWLGQHKVALISNPLGDSSAPTDAQLGGDLLKNNQWAQIPGTDTIFSQVLPGVPSVLPRYATSAANQAGRTHALYEMLGGYGWQVAPELVKFVDGYMAVRGGTMAVLHAYWSNHDVNPYPPSFDPSNPWWPDLSGYQQWSGRVAVLGAGLTQSPTALLIPQRAAEAAYGTPLGATVDGAVTSIAYALEDTQVDFDFLSEDYLDGDPSISTPARIEAGAAVVGPQRYHTIVMPAVTTMSLPTVAQLTELVRQGGTVIAVGGLPAEETRGQDGALARAIKALFGTGPANPVPSSRRLGGGIAQYVASPGDLAAALDSTDAPAVHLTGKASTTRVRALRRLAGDDDVMLLFNEGEEALDMDASFAQVGAPRILDPADGSGRIASQFTTTQPPAAAAQASGRTTVPLHLDPYQMIAVAFPRGGGTAITVPHVTVSTLPVLDIASGGGGRTLDVTIIADAPGSYPVAAELTGRTYRGTVEVPDIPGPIRLDGAWTIHLNKPGASTLSRPLGSWTDLDPAFSGTANYTYEFSLAADQLQTHYRQLLDLGTVHEVATITINGHDLDPLLWRPYRVDVTRYLVTGSNTLTVVVTNTAANEHSDARPSGLFGPVTVQTQAISTVQLSPGA